MSLARSVLAMTSGDPCGVGPEVILKALAEPLPNPIRLIVIGDLSVFEHTAKQLKLRLPRWTVTSARHGTSELDVPLLFIDLAHRLRVTPGESSTQAGAVSLGYLEVAIALIRQGLVHGLVTAPVTKWAIERAGKAFPGHTEYLAKRLSAPFVVMMFVSDMLRVVLLTRHLALREACSQVTKPLLRHTVRVVIKSLRQQFGIRQPRLAICGLNPHAGEKGLFGDEEQRLLLPMMRELNRDGVRLEGPFAADGFFVDPHGYDAVLCCYHDQGLIPFKLLARDHGCQLTLGLPIVRTSPDHGSALNIAGRGVANPGSMRYALQLAASLINRQRNRLATLKVVSHQ